MPGKRGNGNALKHGLYSSRQGARDRLTIEQRRDIMDGAAQHLRELLSECASAEISAGLVSAMARAVAAANGCERTLAVTVGKGATITDVLEGLRGLDPAED